MVAIIIGLIITLIILVVVVTGFQQHKEKQAAEKRVKVAKQKAIIDESEELLVNLNHIPANPKIAQILNMRSLNAAKEMQNLMPEINGLKKKINDLKSRLEAAKDIAEANDNNETNFVLPDNDKQILATLQCIKKLRAILKSEQSKGSLDPTTFTQEDQRLDEMQLTINIESLVKRGSQAQSKEMYGSARQYFEKALQTMSNHPKNTEYTVAKKAQITAVLEEITEALKITNASDAAKKAKSEENELDVLFQPKKKW